MKVAELQTIGQVRKAIREADATARAARRAGDLPALRRAAEQKKRAERRGGELLLTGGRPPDVGEHTARKWRALAAVTAEVFERKLSYAIKRQTVALPCSGPRQIISDWVVGDSGILTRTSTCDAELKSS